MIAREKVIARMSRTQRELDQMVEPVIVALREQKMLTWELLEQKETMAARIDHCHGKGCDEAVELTERRLQEILIYAYAARAPRGLTEEDFDRLREKMQEYRVMFNHSFARRREQE